ncbi:PEP-CTERM sorting domain-containing protein, partial [Microcoleus anatoxicus PTRS2]
MKKFKLALNIIFQSIFWLWNLTFLSIVYLGILPVLAIPLFQATIDGIIPLEFSLTLTTLIAVPTISTIIGARYLIKQPLQLMRLFYGVEAPLFLLCLIRLFLLRELTPASSVIIATIALCIGAFLVEILYGYLGKTENSSSELSGFPNQPKPFILTILIGKENSARIQLLFHSLMLLVGTWAATLLMFYALPVAIVTLVGFFSFAWVQPLIESFQYISFYTIWWLPLSLIMFGFTSSLFVVMPSL